MKNKNTIFIKKARKIHGDKYNYNKINYINNKTKIVIVCKIHGNFLQTPNSHLSGCGCIKCGIDTVSKINLLTKKEFIKTAKKIHGDKYDYSKLNYINAHSKVKIICPTHGEFTQFAYHHSNGHGCSKCANNKKYSTEEFIEKSIKIHGKKYNYNKTNYINSHCKIKIICPLHGEFIQSAYHHLNGSGCKMCGETKKIGGYSNKFFKDHPDYINKKSYLYLVKLHKDTELFYKIGITLNVRRRLLKFKPYKGNYVLLSENKLFNNFKLEQKVLKKLQKFKYCPKDNFGGHTECFKFDDKTFLNIKKNLGVLQ